MSTYIRYSVYFLVSPEKDSQSLSYISAMIHHIYMGHLANQVWNSWNYKSKETLIRFSFLHQKFLPQWLKAN